MYTILSYLKDLTCNAQFNFCFSSYYSFKPFLFFEAFQLIPKTQAVAGPELEGLAIRIPSPILPSEGIECTKRQQENFRHPVLRQDTLSSPDLSSSRSLLPEERGKST